ncbi:tRNA (adenine(58)-N(1))-methyltransferase non-catalytic subunit trm6 [Iris pallida]|uniref:tRNA (adenine(58)-N(1))-methyltransferase non-catalytic subunit TRM6 n=1 Tax=Iris pallida TaxID=29817 RepID=A0AAX6FZN3_IRIPA|nr:tRNA (adenine(58)-N(1))-methyltransferase non-catalytic subunit trm6 [Iris pallida]
MADSSSSAAARPPNPRVTWEGCSVLLDINDGDRLVFARLSPAATIKIGNKKCSLHPLVGCPFGSLFRVESGPRGSFLARCAPSSSSTSAADADATSMQEKDEWQSKDEEKDNRALLDNNTAQGLSSEDIDAMRREGATGDEIVDALIANSSTFGTKTVFSQEKYKLKKQKKYAPKVLLRRPFARSICEAYFKKYPNRIGSLRVDSFSLLLSLANVSAYSDVLVVDMVGGILTGAVAERLGGTGYVCNTYCGTTPHSVDIVRMFNFSSEVCSRIVQAPLSALLPSQKNDNACPELDKRIQSSDLQFDISNACLTSDCILSGESSHLPETAIHKENSSLCEEPAGMLETSFSGNDVAGHTSIRPCSNSVDGIQENTSVMVQKSTPGRQASLEAIKLWKEKGFSSLIVAAPEMELESIIHDLLQVLSYSAPFAIYHQYLLPLATCMHKLQASKMAIGLQISEPWLREYQVLPSRTHPHMQMSAFGGYVLSGTRISNSGSSNGNT